MKMLPAAFGLVCFLVFLAGYGTGVYDTMRRVSEICKPGETYMHNGQRWECRVTVRRMVL